MNEEVKTEEPPTQPTLSSKSEEKIEEDKKIEPSPAEEDVKRSDDDASVCVEAKSNTILIPESEHQPTIVSVEKQPQEEQPANESAGKKLQEQPSVEALEKQPDVQPMRNDALEQSAEEPEAAVAEDIEHSEAVSTKEEISDRFLVRKRSYKNSLKWLNELMT